MITKEDVQKHKSILGEYLIPIGKDKKPIALPFNVDGKVQYCWKRNPNTNEFIKYPDDKLIGAEGLGVSLEPCSLISVDGDMEETSDFMSELPETFTIGKKVNGKTLIRQKIYKAEKRPKAFNYGKGTDDGCCIELLVNTQSKLLGDNRVTLNDMKPAALANGSLENVQKTMAKIYAWSMLTKHYPPSGKKQRDDYVLTVAGTLVSQTDWDTKEREEFLKKLLNVNGDTKEFKNRLDKISYQERQHLNGETIAGVKALTALIGADKHVGLPFIDAIKPQPKTTTKELVVLKLGDFLTKEYPKDFFLQFPLVATGKLVQVWANAGHGKTWFCLELAIAIANGQSFLKYKTHKDIEPHPVPYVEGEMGVAELQKRVQLIQDRYLNMGLRFNPHYFYIAPLKEQPDQNFEPLTTQQGRTNVERAAERIFKETGKKPFIFLDNITALTIMQEKEGADWVELVHWLTKLRARGFTVWFLHHGTKTNKSASGSNVKERAIDMSIKLSIPHEDYMADLDQDQNTQMVVEWDKWREFNFTKWSRPFIANLNRPTTTWSIHPLLTQDQRKIKELLDDGVSKKDIVEKLKKELSRSQIYKTIAYLENWEKEHNEENKESGR